jgi:GNAT superfamily N-acetyltransferase
LAIVGESSLAVRSESFFCNSTFCPSAWSGEIRKNANQQNAGCLLFLQGSILATRSLWSHGRRDVDPAHYRQFFIQGEKSDKKYWSLSGEYPHNLMLAGLGVKPEYQRRGFGSQMVQWGLHVAELQEEILFVGLERLKKEVVFYEQLGFETKGDSTIQVPGDDQKIELVVMACHIHHG